MLKVEAPIYKNRENFRDCTMPSLVTQTIGQATAGLPGTGQGVNGQVVRNENQVNTITSQTVHQDLRAASEAATLAPPLKARDRIPQIPKRVEGNYSPTKNRKKSGRVPKEADKEPDAPTHYDGDDSGLDFTA